MSPKTKQERNVIFTDECVIDPNNCVTSSVTIDLPKTGRATKSIAPAETNITKDHDSYYIDPDHLSTLHEYISSSTGGSLVSVSL